MTNEQRGILPSLTGFIIRQKRHMANQIGSY